MRPASRNLARPVARSWWVTHGGSYVICLLASLCNLVMMLAKAPNIPVETNDEPSHTFIDMTLFLRYVRAGHAYLINLYNNFGTPVVGDAVAVPWAPHGLTYAFFDPVSAMIMNKIVLAFLTLVAMYHLSLRFQPSRLLALWAAGIIYSNPSFLWFLQNHPHQGVLLYFALAMLAVENLIRRPGAGARLWYVASIFTLLLGCGVNGAFLATMFLGVYMLLAVPRSGLRGLGEQIWLALAAFLLVAPQYIGFAIWTPMTARAGFKLFDLPRVHAFTALGLFKNFFFYRVHTTIHMDWAVHQTGILALLIVCGVVMSRASAKAVGGAQTLRRAFWVLGVLPVAMVYVLLLRLDWLDHLPLFRSMDLTRLLWFAVTFLALYGAKAVHHLLRTRQGVTLPAFAVVNMGLAFVAFCFYYAGQTSEIRPHPSIAAALTFFEIFLSFGALMIWAMPYLSIDGRALLRCRIGAPLLVGILLLTLTPRTVAFAYLNRAWRAYPEQFDFMPQAFRAQLPPNTRVAGLYDLTPEAPDQRVAAFGVFGAGGRSIILSRRLKDYLTRRDLTEDGYLTYSFKPAPGARLAELGVRFVITRDDQPAAVDHLGWTLRGETRQLDRTYKLYENDTPTSIVYCADAAGAVIPVRTFNVEPSAIQVNVPAACAGHPLVVTQFKWPGWSIARGAGSPSTDLGAHEVFLSVADPHPGEQIRFEFGPRWVRAYPLMLLSGLLMIVAAVFLRGSGRAKRQRPRHLVRR